jgi:hypothetical protein
MEEKVSPMQDERRREGNAPLRAAHVVASNADGGDTVGAVKNGENLVLEPVVVDVPAQATDEDGRGDLSLLILSGNGGRNGGVEGGRDDGDLLCRESGGGLRVDGGGGGGRSGSRYGRR